MSEVTISQRSLSLEAAVRAANAAIASAREQGLNIVVAVVDRAGHTLCLQRMENAFLHSTGIAEDKAYTSAGFGLPTSSWSANVKGNPRLAEGLNVRPRMVMFGGGLPIIVEESCVGGIGVSGGTAAEDEACARAGLAAL